MSQKSALRVKLALLSIAAQSLRNATLLNKAQAAEHCFAFAIDLIGELVDRVEKLEKEAKP